MPDLDPAARPNDDGRCDFDFLVGDWDVAHRRLRCRLANDDGWDEFPGTMSLRPVLGGLGNVDDNIIELPAGTYRALTLRRFDAEKRLWSIWWIDERQPGIEPPVHGGFVDGVGTFYGADVFDGRPVRVRFLWSSITPVSAVWEQAFSDNDGQTWETNWVMSFRRRAS